MSIQNNSNGGLHAGSIISWLSIALAVLTAIFQGLVTALAHMTESSSQWTFRFRLALVEHLWWIFVTILLLTSLAMSAIAFTAGRGGDPVSVLALSSATFVAIVQYALPAWRHRGYVLTRWLAWTGDSRTAVKRESAKFCSTVAVWRQIAAKYQDRISQLQPTPSDYYGWRLWPVPGLKLDPADLLHQVSLDPDIVWDTEKAPVQVGVYAGADPTFATISLRWGRQQGFTRRVSRAISSMPLSLLRSHPITLDGYDGRGLVLAMGILGRNKGLQPWKLVFHSNPEIRGQLENTSTWSPRPAKVLRSFYRTVMHTQFHGLGEHFVDAATELALLLTDMPSPAAVAWLQLGLEHQDLEKNRFLADTMLTHHSEEERAAILAANYESSYVSMIMSLNAMRIHKFPSTSTDPAQVSCRPDLMCTILLLRARGQKTPWLGREDVQRELAKEELGLSEHAKWKHVTANLVGLETWPNDFSIKYS